MVFYLVGISCLLTFFVFRSVGIDYRAVAIGSLLPTAIDSVIGSASFGHSFLFPVLLLVIVMLATISETRLLRRKLLCVVIGVFFALVLEGTFMFDYLWFWPLNNSETRSVMQLYPSFGAWIIRDIVGLVAIYVLFSIGELYKKENRNILLNSGRISTK